MKSNWKGILTAILAVTASILSQQVLADSAGARGNGYDPNRKDVWCRSAEDINCAVTYVTAPEPGPMTASLGQRICDE